MSQETKIDISYRRILDITVPVMAHHLSYTTMGIIDTVMVGRLGVTALAAVGLGHFISLWCLIAIEGMTTGVTTLVAQAVGARSSRAVGVALWQGIYLGLSLAVSLAALWPAVPSILGWTGASPEMLKIATGYVQVRLLGGVGFALLLAGENFYRGIGRTRIMVFCGIAQLSINCGLNYLFIFGKLGFPQLGARGAALGTVLAQLIVGAFLFQRILRDREYDVRGTFGFSRDVLTKLARLSFPIAVQFILAMGGFVVFFGLVSRLGDAEMAATNVVIQSWGVAFMGAVALATGATALAGQCVGARREDDARRAVHRVLRLGYVLMGMMAVVYFVFPEQLLALFVQGEDLGRILPLARPLFVIVIVCLTLDMVNEVLMGAMRGAGDTKVPMFVDLGSIYVLFIPALLVVTPRYGLIGAWYCLAIHMAAMAALLSWRFRGKAWLKPPVEQDGEPPLADVALDAVQG